MCRKRGPVLESKSKWLAKVNESERNKSEVRRATKKEAAALDLCFAGLIAGLLFFTGVLPDSADCAQNGVWYLVVVGGWVCGCIFVCSCDFGVDVCR